MKRIYDDLGEPGHKACLLLFILAKDQIERAGLAGGNLGENAGWAGSRH